MSSPAIIRRETDHNLHGYVEKKCCGAKLVHPRSNFESCPRCGTRVVFLDHGVQFTEFGEEYLKSRAFKVENNTGIPVDLETMLQHLIRTRKEYEFDMRRRGQ